MCLLDTQKGLSEGPFFCQHLSHHLLRSDLGSPIQRGNPATRPGPRQDKFFLNPGEVVARNLRDKPRNPPKVPGSLRETRGVRTFQRRGQMQARPRRWKSRRVKLEDFWECQMGDFPRCLCGAGFYEKVSSENLTAPRACRESRFGARSAKLRGLWLLQAQASACRSLRSAPRETC